MDQFSCCVSQLPNFRAGIGKGLPVSIPWLSNGYDLAYSHLLFSICQHVIMRIGVPNFYEHSTCNSAAIRGYKSCNIQHTSYGQSSSACFCLGQGTMMTRRKQLSGEQGCGLLIEQHWLRDCLWKRFMFSGQRMVAVGWRQIFTTFDGHDRVKSMMKTLGGIHKGNFCA